MILINILVHALNHLYIRKLHVSLMMCVIKYVYVDIITWGVHCK